MKKRFIILIVGFVLIMKLSAQGLTTDEHSKFDSLINRFFRYSDFEHKSPEIAFGYGPSSLFLLTLHLDSSGTINKVRLMSDHENRDSIFAIFSRINAEVFKTWKSAENGNKAIVIPLVFASPHGDPKYIKDIAENAFKPGVSQNLIVLPVHVFGWGSLHKFSEPMMKTKE